MERQRRLLRSLKRVTWRGAASRLWELTVSDLQPQENESCLVASGLDSGSEAQGTVWLWPAPYRHPCGAAEWRPRPRRARKPTAREPARARPGHAGVARCAKGSPVPSWTALPRPERRPPQGRTRRSPTDAAPPRLQGLRRSLRRGAAPLAADRTPRGARSPAPFPERAGRLQGCGQFPGDAVRPYRLPRAPKDIGRRSPSPEASSHITSAARKAPSLSSG